MTSVLRLGVYRERIEKYGGRANANNTEELLTGKSTKKASRSVEANIVEILEDSITANDGKIQSLVFKWGGHSALQNIPSIRSYKRKFHRFFSKFESSKIKSILIY